MCGGKCGFRAWYVCSTNRQQRPRRSMSRDSHVLLSSELIVAIAWFVPSQDFPGLFTSCKALYDCLDDYFFEERCMAAFGSDITKLYVAFIPCGYKRFFSSQMQARTRKAPPTFQFRRRTCPWKTISFPFSSMRRRMLSPSLGWSFHSTAGPEISVSYLGVFC